MRMSDTLYEYPLKPVAWNERDVLLFANSIGCEPAELQFLYVSVLEYNARAGTNVMQRSCILHSQHFQHTPLC